MKDWTAEELTQLRTLAKKWFKKNGRALPWRETSDPYRIWISEIMLQQTQVATVIPYYDRFLNEFPTVSDLAAADEDRVLFHWAGLGYYRRARQLHAAAKQIVTEHGGEFPRTFKEVLALPGIGRYTAGAICSFAYDQRTPIVEANTQRLYARLLHLKEPLSLATSQESLWEFAASFLPIQKGSGDTNQAVMEIGSQICLPKSPLCSDCPLQALCPTVHAQEQHLVPAPKPSKIYEDRNEIALLVRDANQGYLMRKCEAGERWAGLWDFPRFDVTESTNNSTLSPLAVPPDDSIACWDNAGLQSAVEQFQNRSGAKLSVTNEALQLKHGVTKYRITLRCYSAALEEVSGDAHDAAALGNFQWVSIKELKKLALNSTAKKIAKKILASQE